MKTAKKIFTCDECGLEDECVCKLNKSEGCGQWRGMDNGGAWTMEGRGQWRGVSH